MKVAGLAIGGIDTVRYRGKSVRTGIFKRPTPGPLRLLRNGVEGDIQVDRRYHGGTDKAVYLYSLENLAYWSTRRGEAGYPCGQVGENLTIEGLDDESIHLGDRFEIGSALIEVSQPRVPCFKLGLRMGDPRFVGEFLRSGRTGFYARVLVEGVVTVNDPLNCVHQDPHGVSIPTAMGALDTAQGQADRILKVLAVEALSKAWREDLLNRLNALTPGDPDAT